jgi:antitoxin component of MazEF toxin-antitoxin module
MATLTHRKLIKSGGSLVVTLPKAWADYYQLKSGDRVMVTANRRLVVKPVTSKTNKGSKW